VIHNNCQLAQDWEPQRAKYPCTVEVKRDGFRALAFSDHSINRSGHWQIISRRGNVLNNTLAITSELKYMLNVPEEVVLDGEVFAGDFKLTASITRCNGGHPATERLHFFVFDGLTLDEWKNEDCDLTLQQRKARLSQWFSNAKGVPHVHLVQWATVQTEEQLFTRANSVVQMGHEGVLVKKAQSTYKFRRSFDWLKLTPRNIYWKRQA